MPRRRLLRGPVSTYRLQLRPDFNFRAVRELVPYFAALGISHLYLSPIWKSRPGSTHGYDICEPDVVNPELGGEDEFRALSREAAAKGIGIILDFVPNHLCADALHNPAWRDTLRNGRSSPCAEYFDIEWSPVKPELRNKVLLPILGRQYGEVLEAGELRLVFRDGDFHLEYWSQNFPTNPRQHHILLRSRLDDLSRLLEGDDRTLQEYKSIVFQLEHLPGYNEVEPEAREDRLREASVASDRLARLSEQSEVVRTHLEEVVREFNGIPGQPETFDRLHGLLELQVYRLSYWRTAMHEINYRRFFDINDLAGLRMESPTVFDATHAKAFQLLREGLAQGLRLDHVDGLYSPTEYFRQLRDALSSTSPGAYILVEKILSGSEPLNQEWPVDGTTGYEFLNLVNRLFVRPGSLADLRAIYRRFTRGASRFDQIVYASKRQIIETSMASELNVLAHELNRLSEGDRRSRDFTLDSLQEALREIVACFPVYRTYITERGISDTDRAAVNEAIRRAVARNPAMEASVMDFIREHMLPEKRLDETEEVFLRRMRFAMKFQQYTGPVQAKGVEDTAFYRYTPLVSLNEVGGHPSTIGSPVQDFHAANAYRKQHLPLSMIATATHDTKRGEDARIRLAVLSEIPEEWNKRLHAWSRITSHARTRIGSTYAPDRNDEYLFYQSLLAAWPAETSVATPELLARMTDYMTKAVKEAKVHSSWINPSNEYDAAVARFVERILAGRESVSFLADFVPFARRVALLGEANSLAQLTLKIASPGVADFYQGVEFWDLSLVDPDNRRPVDFPVRTQWLNTWREHAAKCRAEQRPYFLDHGDHYSGASRKAALTALGIEFRAANWALVLHGSYQPIAASGADPDRLVAFARVHNGIYLLALAARWAASSEGWDGLTLEIPDGFPRVWHNVWTNERVEADADCPVERLFRFQSCALLVSNKDTA